MILRLRSLLLSLAAASFIANGAHALTGPSAQHPGSGLDPTSIQYVRSGVMVSAVSFQMRTQAKPVRIRVSAADVWHTCTSSGTSVYCAIPPRAVTDVNELVVQSA